MVTFLAFGIIALCVIPFFLIYLIGGWIKSFLEERRLKRRYEKFKKLYPDTWQYFPYDECQWIFLLLEHEREEE